MTCAAPERDLVPFLAAGTLDSAQRDAAAAHAAGCPACSDELAAGRALVEGLRAQHLTADEVVDAAWSGSRPPHAFDCPRCRAEVETVRAVNRELEAGSPRRRTWAASVLAWAAAVLLAVPAALYFKDRLASSDAPVMRGEASAPPALAIVTVVTLERGGAVSLPRGAVLVEVPVPDLSAGERVELSLRDPAGREQMREADLAVQQGRGRLALDAARMDAGTWRIDVRRVGVDDAARGGVSYELYVPAP